MPPTSAFVIAELEDPGKLLLLERLFCDIWHSDHPPITGALMHAMAHSGSYVAGMFAGGDLMGGAIGFPGRSRTQIGIAVRGAAENSDNAHLFGMSVAPRHVIEADGAKD